MRLLFIIFNITFVFLFGCGDIPCSECNGNGKKIVEHIEESDCSFCSGLGNLKCEYTFENSGFMSTTKYKCSNGKYIPLSVAGFNTGQLSGQTCSACNGKGIVKCDNCNGKGSISQNVKIDEICANCSGKGEISKYESFFK